MLVIVVRSSVVSVMVLPLETSVVVVLPVPIVRNNVRVGRFEVVSQLRTSVTHWHWSAGSVDNPVQRLNAGTKLKKLVPTQGNVEGAFVGAGVIAAEEGVITDFVPLTGGAVFNENHFHDGFNGQMKLTWYCVCQFQ
jgi:hypothetical protein